MLLEMLNGGSSGSVSVVVATVNPSVSSPNDPIECDENGIPLHPEIIPEMAFRVKNTYYIRYGDVVWWNGKLIQCKHKRAKRNCRECVEEHPELKGSGICRESGCSKHPSYGISGERATYCASHRKEGMVSKLCCAEPTCGTISSFNYEGKFRLYCNLHKRDGMINVVIGRCIHPGCKVASSFGEVGGIARYCVSHKLSGMVHIGHKCCLHKGCCVRPSFGYTEGNPECCSEHKMEGMISVVGGHCTHADCNVRPSYGYIGKPIERCATHKLEGMRSIQPKCISDGCGTRPWYGVPGGVETRCFVHKESGDITFPRSGCTVEDCDNPATYGLSQARHCEVHRQPNDMDLVHRKCSKCTRPDVLNCDGHCSCCDSNHFKRKFLARQRETKDAFDVAGITYIYDRLVDSKSCPFRPDFLHSAPHGLITEVDEDQHIRRLESNETTRMLEITRALGKPTLFIRFNPDRYRTSTGEAWEITKRLEVLVKVVTYWQTNPLPAGNQTFVIYMFYDRDDYTKWYSPLSVE